MNSLSDFIRSSVVRSTFQTLLGPILTHTPSGMSYRQLDHYLQLINTKKFQLYDHKSEGNLAKYNSATPPEYKTSNIKVKMQILYGTHDLLITPQVIDVSL